MMDAMNTDGNNGNGGGNNEGWINVEHGDDSNGEKRMRMAVPEPPPSMGGEPPRRQDHPGLNMAPHRSGWDDRSGGGAMMGGMATRHHEGDMNVVAAAAVVAGEGGIYVDETEWSTRVRSASVASASAASMVPAREGRNKRPWQEHGEAASATMTTTMAAVDPRRETKIPPIPPPPPPLPPNPPSPSQLGVSSHPPSEPPQPPRAPPHHHERQQHWDATPAGASFHSAIDLCSPEVAFAMGASGLALLSSDLAGGNSAPYQQLQTSMIGVVSNSNATDPRVAAAQMQQAQLSSSHYNAELLDTSGGKDREMNLETTATTTAGHLYHPNAAASAAEGAQAEDEDTEEHEEMDISDDGENSDSSSECDGLFSDHSDAEDETAEETVKAVESEEEECLYTDLPDDLFVTRSTPEQERTEEKVGEGTEEATDGDKERHEGDAALAATTATTVVQPQSPAVLAAKSIAKERLNLRLAELRAKAKLADARLRMARQKMALGGTAAAATVTSGNISVSTDDCQPRRLSTNTKAYEYTKAVVTKKKMNIPDITALRNIHELRISDVSEDGGGKVRFIDNVYASMLAEEASRTGGVGEDSAADGAVETTMEMGSPPPPPPSRSNSSESEIANSSTAGATVAAANQRLQLLKLRLEIKKKEQLLLARARKKQADAVAISNAAGMNAASSGGGETPVKEVPPETPGVGEGVKSLREEQCPQNAAEVGNAEQCGLGPPELISDEQKQANLQNLRNRQKKLKQQNEISKIKNLIHRQRDLLGKQGQELMESASQLQECTDEIQSQEELLDKSDHRLEEMTHRKRIVEGMILRTTEKLMQSRKCLHRERRHQAALS